MSEAKTMDLIQFLEQLRTAAGKADVDAGSFVRNVSRAIQEVTDYRNMVEYLQGIVQELSRHIIVHEPQTQWPEIVNDAVLAGCFPLDSEKSELQPDPKESGQS